MESKLGLNMELVNQARQSAAKVADDVQVFIDQHTTVTVERAVCRVDPEFQRIVRGRGSPMDDATRQS